METDKKPKNPICEQVTLRDYFAAKVMAEIPIVISGINADDWDYDVWARKCYKRADAMLKQREL